jgi:hypothetical protein
MFKVNTIVLLSALLHRHGELDSPSLGFLGDPRRSPELLIHQRAGHRGVSPALERRLDPLEDQMLAVGDSLGLFRLGLAFDPKSLDDGAAVVEGEDVELVVVAQSMGPEKGILNAAIRAGVAKVSGRRRVKRKSMGPLRPQPVPSNRLGR